MISNQIAINSSNFSQYGVTHGVGLYVAIPRTSYRRTAGFTLQSLTLTLPEYQPKEDCL